MRTNRRFAGLSWGIATLSLGALLAGCSGNGSRDFEIKSRTQQVDALKGSMDQLSPERKKQIEAQANAVRAAHERQAGQAGQAGAPGGNR
ncbi:MAG TPA: hypothetical protein VFB21_04830 [Chthonomonadaceae bacterium]|nr:hypothetical protein [Chthonomonadaceae bacterium]